MEAQGAAQSFDPAQQSPSRRFMGMSPAIPSVPPVRPSSSSTMSHQWTAGSSHPVSSPLQPSNQLALLDQGHEDNDSALSDGSEMLEVQKQVVDYQSWSADQVRKECTRRGLKLKASMKKGERIAVLRRHDVARAAYGGRLLDDEGESAGGNAGDVVSRAEIDAKAVRAKSHFWQDARAAFAQQYSENHERNFLMFADNMFTGADPSVVKLHSAVKLLKMAKAIIKNYFIAEQRFTASGRNEDELWKFVDKRGAVLYMRKRIAWLVLRALISQTRIPDVQRRNRPSPQRSDGGGLPQLIPDRPFASYM
ncbi:hypothetical protein PHYPSEUDO_007646 [Phytophthora pseudosyringae]|uniref:Uncharacterized protein n=1 Tax=Phytophthora pseudosyringae TaxID=221518 RepID=A0A8T1VG20_9STRA|nr:hypothetical protein PHYPSEUDO_007646 [Phytophthora pseudosyringae]